MVESKFVIKTRAFNNRNNKSSDIYSEEFFENYPSNLDIYAEMRKLNLLGYGIIFSQVEKIYHMSE